VSARVKVKASLFLMNQFHRFTITTVFLCLQMDLWKIVNFLWGITKSYYVKSFGQEYDHLWIVELLEDETSRINKHVERQTYVSYNSAIIKFRDGLNAIRTSESKEFYESYAGAKKILSWKLKNSLWKLSIWLHMQKKSFLP
jgi:hypothetical protein